MTEQEYYQQQAQLQANVLTKANQYCHAPILSETVSTEAPSPVCRGARNIQIQFFFRLGVIEEETDEAWRKALTALQK